MVDAENVVDAFRDYVGIKLHFNNKQYTFSPGGLRKLTADTVMKRKDIEQIIKFSKIFNKRDERIQYLISMFKNNPDLWIGEMGSVDLNKMHNHRMGTIMALDYNFSSDCELIKSYMKQHQVSLSEILVANNDRPLLIKCTDFRSLNDETLAIIQKFIDYCSQETKNPMWEKKSLMIKKYSTLINVNSNIEKIIGELINYG